MGTNNNKDNGAMAEQKKFEDELAEMVLPENSDFDVMLEKKINRRIRKIALKSVLIVAAVAALIILGISPLMRVTNTDPVKLNSDEVMTKDNEIKRHSTLFRVMDAWIETQYPMCELDWIEAKSLHFGKYEIDAHVIELSKHVTIGAPSNVTLHMTRGKMEIESDPSALIMLKFGIFAANEEYSTIDYDLSEIRKLPESAWMTVAVSEKTPKSVASLRKDVDLNDEDELSLDWIRVHTESCHYQGGLNLGHCKGDMEPFPDEMNEQQLKSWYLSNIKLLYEHPEIWEDLGIGMETAEGGEVFYDEEVLKELYEKAKADKEFQSQYYYISGSKEKVLRYIESRDLWAASLVDARLSRFVD
jgi:hypothetical protein